MATTTYKGATLPTVGGDSGTWGTSLNTLFAVFDRNLGGIVTKTLTNANITLTDIAPDFESQKAILRLTGTLSGNVQIITSCQGFTIVENLCTLGAYAVTITNGVSGVTVPYGRHVVIFDATNGARVAASDGFPSGTAMLFVQTSAPTGWTKSTTHNDKALRVVSGTASSGGTTAFTSVFAARTITAANMPVHSHGVVDPGHSHYYPTYMNFGTLASLADNGGWHFTQGAYTNPSTTGISIGNAGSGTAMDFAVQHVDCIIATKD